MKPHLLIATPLLAAATVAGTALAADDEGTANTETNIEGLGEFYFAFDSARVPENTSDSVAKIAEYAKAHPLERIVLDGSADSTGPSAYNVALSIRRAKAIQSKLIAAGVDPENIVVVAYGEDSLRRTADQFDRRVTAWASADPLYAIIDSSLVRGTAVVWDKPVAAAELAPPPSNVATR